MLTQGLLLLLQSNKLEKIPAGAFDNLSNLRELYLQNNLLSNEGMDNETFRWEKALTNHQFWCKIVETQQSRIRELIS